MCTRQKILIVSVAALLLASAITVKASETRFYFEERGKDWKTITGFVPQNINLADDKIAKQIAQEGVNFALNDPKNGKLSRVLIVLYYFGKQNERGERVIEVDASYKVTEEGAEMENFEVSVMGMERRSWIIWPYGLVNQKWEEPRGKATLLETATG